MKAGIGHKKQDLGSGSIGLDCWFKCGWCQYLPETTGWRVVSFAKVETLPGAVGGRGVYQEGKESRSGHSEFEPPWSHLGSDQKAAESMHLKSGDEERRTHQQRQSNCIRGRK